MLLLYSCHVSELVKTIITTSPRHIDKHVYELLSVTKVSYLGYMLHQYPASYVCNSND